MPKLLVGMDMGNMVEYGTVEDMFNVRGGYKPGNVPGNMPDKGLTSAVLGSIIPRGGGGGGHTSVDVAWPDGTVPFGASLGGS